MDYIETVPKNKEEEVVVVWRRGRRKHEIISKHIKKTFMKPSANFQQSRHRGGGA